MILFQWRKKVDAHISHFYFSRSQMFKVIFIRYQAEVNIDAFKGGFSGRMILMHKKVISISAEEENWCIQKWFLFQRKKNLMHTKRISLSTQEENWCIQKEFLYQHRKKIDAYKSDFYFSGSRKLMHTKVISISAEEKC